MPSYRLPLLGPPYPQQQELIDYLWEPSPKVKKPVLQCGLGWAKTTLGIEISCRLLNSSFRTRTLFLEPDNARLEMVFWAAWKENVPAMYYNIKTLGTTGRKYIEWKSTKNCLYPTIRDVHGNSEMVADAFRGIEFTNVIDDETALQFNLDQYINTFNRIRGDSPIRFYLCMTTPKMGPYASLLKLDGIKMFYGKTSDNVYLMERFPNYVEEMSANMSAALIRREIYGELVALEGSIWSMFSYDTWPNGNMDEYKWDRNAPYILAGDIGVQASWLIIQKIQGREVIVGEYHPNEGGTRQNIAFILNKYRQPAKIITGGDLETRSRVGGGTSLIEIREALGRYGMTQCQILQPQNAGTDKSVQYNSLSNILERRLLTYSNQCEYDGDKEKERGFLALIKQDTWPKPACATMFNKDKRRGAGIEDVRDAALYFAAVQHPLTVVGVR